MTTVKDIQKIALRCASTMDEPFALSHGATSGHAALSMRQVHPVGMVAVALLAFYFLLKIAVAFSQIPHDRNAGNVVLMCALSLLGVFVFWIDMCRGKIYEGILRLVLILALANIILPCLWITPPERKRGRDTEDEEDDYD